MNSQSIDTTPPRTTALHAWHVAHGGKMVPFAGYEMPVQYAAGVLKEHLHTRAAAGLFDVSHMGQAILSADDGSHATVAAALEALIPADVLSLAPGRQRYSQLLGPDGGILDDLMVARPADPAEAGSLRLVVNAACKDADYAHIAAHLPAGVRLAPLADLSLIALQGPAAEAVLAPLIPQSAAMRFMDAQDGHFGPHPVHLTRSGYTGEDGFEISISDAAALDLWTALAAHPDVLPIGLGARDSLRLEAGLCLYGNDIDTGTSPVEANLTWSIQKRRREAGGFPGAARIQRELREGPSRLRVGLLPQGRAPMRAGVQLYADADATTPIGRITSGGFGPSVNGPIAMGIVDRDHAAAGTPLYGDLRGQRTPVAVVDLPFVPNRFKR